MKHLISAKCHGLQNTFTVISRPTQFFIKRVTCVGKLLKTYKCQPETFSLIRFEKQQKRE